MSEEQPDRELVALVADRQRGRAETLYRRRAAWLPARLTRRCADPASSSEVLQDTFVAVWKGAGRCRGAGEAAGVALGDRRPPAGGRRCAPGRRAAKAPVEEADLGGRVRRGPGSCSAVGHGDLGRALDRLSPELRSVRPGHRARRSHHPGSRAGCSGPGRAPSRPGMMRARRAAPERSWHEGHLAPRPRPGRSGTPAGGPAQSSRPRWSSTWSAAGTAAACWRRRPGPARSACGPRSLDARRGCRGSDPVERLLRGPRGQRLHRPAASPQPPPCAARWLIGVAGRRCCSRSSPAHPGPGDRDVFVALAPVLPMLGVALAFGARTDPDLEMAVASPYSARCGCSPHGPPRSSPPRCSRRRCSPLLPGDRWLARRLAAARARDERGVLALSPGSAAVPVAGPLAGGWLAAVRLAELDPGRVADRPAPGARPCWLQPAPLASAAVTDRPSPSRPRRPRRRRNRMSPTIEARGLVRRLRPGPGPRRARPRRRPRRHRAARPKRRRQDHPAAGGCATVCRPRLRAGLRILGGTRGDAAGRLAGPPVVGLPAAGRGLPTRVHRVRGRSTTSRSSRSTTDPAPAARRGAPGARAGGPQQAEATKKVRALSGGMRRRLGLAQALLGEARAAGPRRADRGARPGAADPVPRRWSPRRRRRTVVALHPPDRGRRGASATGWSVIEPGTGAAVRGPVEELTAAGRRPRVGERRRRGRRRPGATSRVAAPGGGGFHHVGDPQAGAEASSRPADRGRLLLMLGPDAGLEGGAGERRRCGCRWRSGWFRRSRAPRRGGSLRPVMLVGFALWSASRWRRPPQSRSCRRSRWSPRRSASSRRPGGPRRPHGGNARRHAGSVELLTAPAR